MFSPVVAKRPPASDILRVEISILAEITALQIHREIRSVTLVSPKLIAFNAISVVSRTKPDCYLNSERPRMNEIPLEILLI